jgi:hypothetical protein
MPPKKKAKAHRAKQNKYTQGRTDIIPLLIICIL